MRALVLSGGEGSRLRPLTHTSAKQLIPVAGKPILFHALDSIAEAGIREVGIVVGSTAAEVEAAVGDGSRWGFEVTYIKQDAPLGLAHAVLAAESFVTGQPFLMYLGDNVLLEGVSRFVRMFEQTKPDAQIFLAQVPEPQRFGVAVLEGDRVVRLVEKPTEPISDLALVGVYLFDDSVLEAAKTLSPSWRGEYEITEAIQWLVDNGRTVRAEMVGGWWKDTGLPDDLLEANRMMLANVPSSNQGELDAASSAQGPVVIEEGAKVVRSTLVGPVVIGAGTVIEDCVVGPDVSIEHGCRIERSQIDDSIIMEGAQIADVPRLSGSILGRNVVVGQAKGLPAHRLILGDSSRVETS